MNELKEFIDKNLPNSKMVFNNCISNIIDTFSNKDIIDDSMKPYSRQFLLTNYQEYREYLFNKYIELIQIPESHVFLYIHAELQDNIMSFNSIINKLFFDYVNEIDKDRNFIRNLFKQQRVNIILAYLWLFKLNDVFYTIESKTIINIILFQYTSMDYLELFLDNLIYNGDNIHQICSYIIETIYKHQISMFYLENMTNRNKYWIEKGLEKSSRNFLRDGKIESIYYSCIGIMKGNTNNNLQIFKKQVQKFHTSLDKIQICETCKLAFFSSMDSILIFLRLNYNELNLFNYIKILFNPQIICFQYSISIIMELLVPMYKTNDKMIQLINWIMELKEISNHIFNSKFILNVWFVAYKTNIRRTRGYHTNGDEDMLCSLRYLVKNCRFKIEADHIFMMRDYFDLADMGLFLLNELDNKDEIEIFISKQIKDSTKHLIIKEYIIYDYIYQYPKLFNQSSKITSHVLCALDRDYNDLFKHLKNNNQDDDDHFVPLDQYLEHFKLYKEKCINRVMNTIMPIYELAKLIVS